MNTVDRSHDPARRSWVEGADAHRDFPIQNLPFARVLEGKGPATLAVAIGDQALLLPQALDAGWGGDLDPATRQALVSGSLNAFAGSATAESRKALRLALSDALGDPGWEKCLRPALHAQSALTFKLPFHIHDYTDFYASINHATNVGSMFRPDNPLLPNYKWMPIGYHGRSSSLVVSGAEIRRPTGQTKANEAAAPSVGPSRSLDYEDELGLFIGTQNSRGTPVPAAEASAHIFGYCLLNDWSARDIQSWEYQPLGPFLAKNFATSISPWVVTAEALIPFRVPMPARPEGDPAPLDYLRVPDDATLAVDLEVLLRTRAMADRGEAPFQVSRVQFGSAMYWSPAQLVTHHASNGCNLSPGDLLGTGTISGTTADSRGCLLERTWRGAEPLSLPDGTMRRFLEDGDEVIMRGRCVAEHAVSIGFGECTGRVIPA